MKQPTLKVAVTLNEDKYEVLKAQADQRGVSINSYCRVLLSEWAETPLQKAA